MNRIGIIGQGFVGNAVAQKFQQYYQLLTYDLDKKKANATEEEVLNCNIVFLCLPTPMLPDGKCDTSIVSGVLEKIVKLKQPKIVVIKSTVPPLTGIPFDGDQGLSVAGLPCNQPQTPDPPDPPLAVE